MSPGPLHYDSNTRFRSLPDETKRGLVEEQEDVPYFTDSHGVF